MFQIIQNTDIEIKATRHQTNTKSNGSSTLDKLFIILLNSSSYSQIAFSTELQSEAVSSPTFNKTTTSVGINKG
ncbi:MAG: hypothetical protein ACOZBL_00450 [Patescibacteria group bacterium]